MKLDRKNDCSNCFVRIEGSNLAKYTEKRYSEVSFGEDVKYDDILASKEQPTSLTFSLLIAAATGLLTSALPAGYNIGVVNTPQAILKEFCNETLYNNGIELDKSHLEFLWSFVVSLLLIGAIIGSGCGGWLADHLGRKRTILLNSTFGLISAGLFPLSSYLKMVSVMLVGRFVAGIHCGISSTLVPIYLMEIAPESHKGAMGTLQVLGLCLGLLTAQILGQEEMLGTRKSWPLLLSLNSVFIFIGLTTLFLCPESPIFLYVMQGKKEKAVKALQTLKNLSPAELEADIAMMKREQKLQETNNTKFATLFSRDLRLPVFLVCALHIGQQLIGINAVFYYSTMTFEKIGLTLKQSQYASIGTAAINALMSVIAVPLVNRYRRRVLLSTSTIGTTICLVILCLSMKLQYITWMPYVTIASFLTFVAIYNVGLGPIPYMIGSELLDQGAKSSGMSLGCLTNWLTNFLIAITFPLLQNHLNEYVFLIFAFFGLILTAVILFKLPETKN